MKKIFILCTCLIFAICLTGCKQAKKNNGLKGGFDNNSIELLPSTQCGFTTDKTELKIGEDLTVKLYFGTISNYPNDYPYVHKHNNTSPDNVLTEILMKYGTYTKVALQDIKRNCHKPQYTYNYENIETSLYKEIDDFTAEKYPHVEIAYSKYEMIVVPSSYFVGEMGSIQWVINIYGIWAEGVDRENYIGIATSLYYRIERNNVILYDSYYNFVNDIRPNKFNFMKNCNSK